MSGVARNIHYSMTTPGTINTRRDTFQAGRFQPTQSTSGAGALTPTLSACFSGPGKSVTVISGDTVANTSRFELAWQQAATVAAGFYTNWGTDTTSGFDDRPAEVVLCFDLYINAAWPGTTGNFTFLRWGCDGRGVSNPFTLRYNNAANPTARLQYTTWNGSSYDNSTHTIPNGDHIPSLTHRAVLIYLKPSSSQTANDGIVRVWFGDKSTRDALRTGANITFNLADSQACVYGKLDWVQVYANPAAAAPTVSGANTGTQARCFSNLDLAELALVDPSITLAASDFTSKPVWRERNTLLGVDYDDPDVGANREIPVFTHYDDGLWGTSPVSVSRTVEVATDAAFTAIIDTLSDTITQVTATDVTSGAVAIGYWKVGHVSAPADTLVYIRSKLTINNGIDPPFTITGDACRVVTGSRAAPSAQPWEHYVQSCWNDDEQPFTMLRWLALRARNDAAPRHRRAIFLGDTGYADERTYDTARSNGGGSVGCQSVEDWSETFLKVLIDPQMFEAGLHAEMAFIVSDHDNCFNDAHGCDAAARFEGTTLVTPSTGWADGWTYNGHSAFVTTGAQYTVEPYGVWRNCLVTWGQTFGGLLPRVGTAWRYDMSAHNDPRGAAVPSNSGEHAYIDTYASRTPILAVARWSDPNNLLSHGATKLHYGKSYTRAAIQGCAKPVLLPQTPESLTDVGPGGTSKVNYSWGRDPRVAVELGEILGDIQGNTNIRLSLFGVGDDHVLWSTRHDWAVSHPRVGPEIGGGSNALVQNLDNLKWPNIPASGTLPGDQDPTGPMFVCDGGEWRGGAPTAVIRSACVLRVDETALTVEAMTFDLSEGALAPSAVWSRTFTALPPSGGGITPSRTDRLRRGLLLGVTR